MQPYIPVPLKHKKFLKVQRLNGSTQGIDSMAKTAIIDSIAKTAIIGNQVHHQLYIFMVMQEKRSEAHRASIKFLSP
jgi:hypothetical protein